MQGLNPGQGGSRQGQGGLSWSTPQTKESSQSNNTSAGNQKAPQPILSTSKPATSTTSTASKTKNVAESDMTRLAGSFIAGVVVGAFLMWGWGATMGNNAPVAVDTNNTTGTNSNGTTNNSGGTIGGAGVGTSVGTAAPQGGTTSSGVSSTPNLEIASQNAGMEVLVTDATVSAPTWVVVYEMYQGKPVRALGATMFFPEYNGKGGIVSLLRATKPNTMYFVGQSLDTGNHTFTPHVNKEVLDSSGRMIGTTFTTNK